MISPDPSQMAQITHMGALQAALPALEQIINTELKAIDNRVFAAIDAGNLDIQAGTQAWVARRYLLKLLSRLSNKEIEAKAISHRLQPFLDH